MSFEVKPRQTRKPKNSQKETKMSTLSLARKTTALSVVPAKAETPAVQNIAHVVTQPAIPGLIELQPFISCFVQPANFERAVNSHYSQIFVETASGYLKHMKLSNGRFVRMKVDKLPNVPIAATLKRVEIKEELNFLPAGKIPAEFWGQIVEFFRQVMKLKRADYEAHAWILWEPEKGYYISVPKQTVSKASVSFSYDAEALPPGAVIVVDIHSHNTMGAFYSGTDNNNDKTGIYYSGVVGKITDDSYEWVMRFNMHETKMSCDLEDIFDMAEEVPQVPKAWLDQVQITSSQYQRKTGHYMGSYKPSQQHTQSQTSPFDAAAEWLRNNDRSSGIWTAQGSINQGKTMADAFQTPQVPQASLWETELTGRSTTDELNELYPDVENNMAPLGSKFDPEAHVFKGTRPLPSVEELETELETINRKLASRLQCDEHGEIIMADPVGDDTEITHGPDYDYNASQYGVTVADAHEVILQEIQNLEGFDEGLQEVISEAYHMMSSRAQEKLQQNGIN